MKNEPDMITPLRAESPSPALQQVFDKLEAYRREVLGLGVILRPHHVGRQRFEQRNWYLIGDGDIDPPPDIAVPAAQSKRTLE